MGNWRIDTIDARGGLAFASWRDDDHSGVASSDNEAPCIFVGPPDFQPEPVANGSIALSAGRGTFQTGLFVEGLEVAFPTPTAVAEFVRRAYLRSGGGDGAGGGGGEGPTPRPVDRPDMSLSIEFVEEDVGGERLRPAILEAIAKFGKASDDLKVGSATAFNDWPSAVLAVGKEEKRGVSDGPDILASAAFRLIYEMVKRLPPERDAYALAQWRRDAFALGDLLVELGLWPLLASDRYSNQRDQLSKGLIRTNHDLAILRIFRENQHFDSANDFLLFSLFIDGPDLDDRIGCEQFIRRIYEWHPCRTWLARPTRVIDPVSTLARIPLPEEFENFAGPELKNGQSLYHALTAFPGHPIAAMHRRGLIDVILLASAFIVGPRGGQSFSSADFWPMLFRRHDISNMRRAALQELVDEAWRWLREHLPAMVFATSVEKAIESAASLRYVPVK